ncbi:MAG: metallophosphoesterase [Xanthomonadaceae bacterium]|nr:metallophosphoesterase [Xanthomonadaceae bacterium]
MPRVSDFIPATPSPVPRRSWKIAWITRGAWVAAIAVLCIAWPAWEYPNFDIEPQQRLKAFVQLALLHGSWLLWPLLAQSAFKAIARFREHRPWRASGAVALGTACALLCWARFVEPNELVVRRTVIPAPVDLNIALVADMHAGIFTRTGKLEQMVRKLNSLHVDMVLIAGDLTYDPPYNLDATLAPLRHIDKPVYVVLGNHDVQLPGPPLAHKIVRAMAAQNVHFIEHRVIDFGNFRLAGLYDWWSGRDDTAFLKALPHDKPLLVLMHQPHSLRALRGVDFALAMAGHTHGGQVYIPWLTEKMFMLTRDEQYVNGYYDTPTGKLFVTPGIGVTGVPLRFDCPPTIDVLELRRNGRGHDAAKTSRPSIVHTSARISTPSAGSPLRTPPATPSTQGGKPMP